MAQSLKCSLKLYVCMYNQILCDEAVALLGFNPKKWNNVFTEKYLYIIVHSNFISNSQRVETTTMFYITWKFKQNVYVNTIDYYYSTWIVKFQMFKLDLEKAE